MHPETSERYQSLPPYPLAGIPETRRRLIAEGVDIIDLSAGDADLAPPPAAVKGLQDAVENPDMSRYPFNLGLAAFREEVAGWMKKRFGVDVDPAKEILPLIGSKDGIAHLPFGFLNPRDAALIPDPGYQPYKGGVLLAGGEPILVPLRPENDFLIPLEDLPPDDVARSKLLYLNYPNNPTTALAPREYLQEAVEFCHAHDLLLIYDNAYSELAFDGYKPPSRMGWAVGDADLVGVLAKVKSFVDTGAFLGIQAACAAALRSWDEWVPDNIETFRQRRNAAVEGLTAQGFDLSVPKATMYLWVPVPTHEASMAFCRRALEQEGVIVLPGSSMGKGGEGFFRVALTTSEDRLRIAATRLGRLLP